MSWGIGCFTKIPGVYADVGKATCFIDWAARCVDGTDIDNFGTSNGCARDWAKTTYCDYKARIDYLESEVSLILFTYTIFSFVILFHDTYK